MSATPLTDLLPCPFCGGEADHSIGQHGDGTPWPYVECVDCGATTDPEVWNRRHDGCAARNMIIEECAKLCDDTATLQGEMAKDPDTEESMVTYRKARAWDATVMAAKIRALKK